MKICYLANAFLIHTQRWVKYFTEKGHEVHLISFEQPDVDLNGSNIHIVKTNKKYLYISFLYKALQFRRIINEIKPDIVHAHYVTKYGVIGAFTGFHPFVVTVWGSDVLVNPKESIIFKKANEFALKRADVITTTAQFMGGYLNKMFKLPESKIVRIPLGIDLKVFHCGYQEEVKKLRAELKIEYGSPVILSNRNLVAHHNIQCLIDAIPYVIRKYPNVIFVFIRGYGSIDFENKMKLKAKKLGIIYNIRFIPQVVTPKEMAVYLNMADAFLSIPKTDQFGCCVMEGMACGVIPIMSNIDVYKQYLEDGKNTFFVNPKNPEEVAEKIIYCIEHPEIKEKFFRINRKIIEEKEDFNKNIKKQEELYENLLNREIQK